jgi:cytochrome c5
MNPRTGALIVAASLLAVLVAGCPKQTGTEVTKTETTAQPVTSPAASGTETKAAGMTTAEAGKQLVQERCTQCHSLDRVQKEKADAEEWGKTVAQMQKNAEKMKKTPITDEEATKIVEYLAATYGK